MFVPLFKLVEFHLGQFPKAHGVFEFLCGVGVAREYLGIDATDGNLGLDVGHGLLARGDICLGFLNLLCGAAQSLVALALLCVAQLGRG